MTTSNEFDGLFGEEPRAVRISDREVVGVCPFDGGATDLRVVEPRIEGIDVVCWAAGHRDWIEETLAPGGALLLRGFEVPSVEVFGELARALAPDLMDYTERSTPRSGVSGRVFTSTEYPPDQPIPLHNELSYAHRWPSRIWFHCVTPPGSGGATPIADSREVLRRLDPAVRERFTERGVLYVRNYGVGPGLSWRETFQTDSVADVEAYCREAGIEFEWRGEDLLRTRARRPATIQHPRTGETVWFNQAHLHHVSALIDEVRESLLASLDEDELPFNTFYGDGTPIGDEEVGAVNEAYRSAQTVFPWRRGDVLLLDNVLVAHGREPFGGERRIVVAMA